MVDDQTGAPTWARALADATAELMRQNELIARHSGLYRIAVGGYTSRDEFANDIIRIMQDLSGRPGGWGKVRPITPHQYPLPARRPRNSAISRDKVKRVFGIEMAAWRQQLQDCLGDPGTHDAFQGLVRGR